MGGTVGHCCSNAQLTLDKGGELRPLWAKEGLPKACCGTSQNVTVSAEITDSRRPTSPGPGGSRTSPRGDRYPHYGSGMAQAEMGTEYRTSPRQLSRLQSTKHGDSTDVESHAETEAVAMWRHFDLDLSELAQLPDDGWVGRRPPHRFETGSVYDGQWLGPARHGFGRQRWPDGARYDGEWGTSLPEGRGRFRSVEGDVYTGEWRGGRFHGLGMWRLSSCGTIYAGAWVDGERDGLGVETSGSGSSDGAAGGGGGDARYAGRFRRGHREGAGTCSWPDGSHYAGEWAASSISGAGRYIASGGSRAYSGQWQGFARHGFGQYDWADSRKYSGQYEVDQASGFGIFVWPDGRRHEGFWEGGERHGLGRQVAPDGRIVLKTWWRGEAGGSVDGASDTPASTRSSPPKTAQLAAKRAGPVYHDAADSRASTQPPMGAS